jgi:hypothetical protein
MLLGSIFSSILHTIHLLTFLDAFPFSSSDLKFVIIEDFLHALKSLIILLRMMPFVPRASGFHVH